MVPGASNSNSRSSSRSSWDLFCEAAQGQSFGGSEGLKGMVFGVRLNIYTGRSCIEDFLACLANLKKWMQATGIKGSPV